MREGLGAVFQMPQSQYLSDQELYDLTGWWVKPKRIEFLRKKGIPFLINARGRLVVDRNAVFQTKPVEPKLGVVR